MTNSAATTLDRVEPGATLGAFLDGRNFLERQRSEPILVEDIEEQQLVVANVVPWQLLFTNRLLLSIAILSFGFFIAAFFGITAINGFVSLLAAIASFGLFRVFHKIENIVKRKKQ